MLLFCLHDLQSGLIPDYLLWAFIIWIPDGERIREKMLLTSNIRNLKEEFGPKNIQYEYPAKVVSHLNWKIFQDTSKSKTFDAEFLAPHEAFVKTSQIIR